MDKEITSQLTTIFRNVFKDEGITLSENMTAADVPAWDSLTNMVLMVEVEKTFNIHITFKKLRTMEKLGDLVRIIHEEQGGLSCS